MTQKELAYIEDAIGHESTIISILEDEVSNIKDENLVSFIENELAIHNDNKEKLINILEAKINE